MIFEADPFKYKTVGQQTLTVSTSVVTLSKDVAVTGNNVTDVLIRINDQPLRMRLDGGVVAAGDGFTASNSEVYQISTETEIEDLQFIRKGDTDSEVDAIFLQRIG